MFLTPGLDVSDDGASQRLANPVMRPLLSRPGFRVDSTYCAASYDSESRPKSSLALRPDVAVDGTSWRQPIQLWNHCLKDLDSGLTPLTAQHQMMQNQGPNSSCTQEAQYSVLCSRVIRIPNSACDLPPLLTCLSPLLLLIN